MWYVVQVRTGSEENIRLQCERKIPHSVLEECFIPYYEEKKKIQGEWKIQKKILFPGYIFLVTEDVHEVWWQLKGVFGLTKLLKVDLEVIPLKEEEIRFLLAFGGKEQLVKMSEGIIENSKVIVTSGPLQGWEGLIKKIDRHKRKAYLELEMFGRKQLVQVGLEIVRKTV